MLLLPLALHACGEVRDPGLKGRQIDCAGIEAATARAQLAISMQMLRMEVARDEIEVVGSDAVKRCDPQVSRPVYESVSSELLHLVACARSAGQREKLREIAMHWRRLQDRHESAWRVSQDVPSLQPKERCMRASGVASSRISIERNWEAVWTQFAPPD